jgi:hypothetical protein
MTTKRAYKLRILLNFVFVFTASSAHYNAHATLFFLLLDLHFALFISDLSFKK